MTTEQYKAYQNIIRISHVDEATIHIVAEELAIVTAERLDVDGANITYGRGLWKGVVEFSAAIEIVTRFPIMWDSLLLIRNHVTATGLTAFFTENEVSVAELY